MQRFAGAPTILRLILRLDRIKLPLWILGLGFMIVITPISIRDVTETEATTRGVAPEVILAEQAALVDTNAAMVALSGPADALDTFGGRYLFELGAMTLAIVALMNVLLVARHTRASEEAGRTELLRSSAVGTWAIELALGIVVTVANAALALIVILAFGLDGVDLGATSAFAVAMALMGMAFAALTLMWAQVFEHSRSSTGAGIATIAAAYALRAAGDVQDGWLSLVSPIGLVQAVNPFGDLSIAPLLVLVAVIVATLGAGAWLAARRDVGAGIVAPRPGPPAASARLVTPLGLAWRLHRGIVLWWAVGVGFLGMVYGSVLSAVDDFVQDNESMQEMLEQMGAIGDQFRDAFLTMLLTILGFVAAGAVLQLTLRPRAEEMAGHAEMVLAARVSRRSWLGAQLVIAWLIAPVLMLVAAVALTVSDGLVVGEIVEPGSAIGAAMTRVPALWAMIGITTALYGASKRLAPLGWVVFGVTVLFFLFGELLRLPDLALNLSTLYHTNHQPVEAQPFLSLLTLTTIGLVSTALGLGLFQRRDVA